MEDWQPVDRGIAECPAESSYASSVNVIVSCAAHTQHSYVSREETLDIEGEGEEANGSREPTRRETSTCLMSARSIDDELGLGHDEVALARRVRHDRPEPRTQCI